MATKLTDEQRSALPESLPDWSMVPQRDAIRRTFRFRDFNQAWGFMTRVALLAERHDHHPEWSNVWATVEIVLTSHDVDGLSKRDLAMAKAIDALLL